MTDQHPENNRILHELLGKHWHEDDGRGLVGETCACGLNLYDSETRTYRPVECDNPDYAADPRLVLEAMKEKNRLGEFLNFLCRQRMTVPEMSYRIDVDLILDKTGRLRDLAIKFLKEGK